MYIFCVLSMFCVLGLFFELFCCVFYDLCARVCIVVGCAVCLVSSLSVVFVICVVCSCV